MSANNFTPKRRRIRGRLYLALAGQGEQQIEHVTVATSERDAYLALADDSLKWGELWRIQSPSDWHRAAQKNARPGYLPGHVGMSIRADNLAGAVTEHLGGEVSRRTAETAIEDLISDGGGPGARLWRDLRGDRLRWASFETEAEQAFWDGQTPPKCAD